MPDRTQGPNVTPPQALGKSSELASASPSTDLSTLTLGPGLGAYESVERTPHTRESVAQRWRFNREIPDTGTRMMIEVGGKAG